MSDLGPLTFNVPEPAVRPGGTPDFSSVGIPKAGSVSRPEVDADPASIRDLAYSIIRVLNRDGEAVGPWAGLLSDEELLEGLRHMMTLRAFDARMLMAQRQGKTSFYMQHMGEEAVSCAFRKALLARRHEFSDLSSGRPADRRRLSDGRHDVPDLFQRAGSAEGPTAAGPLFLEEARLLLDLRQSRDPVHPGGRLGDGLGDQERHQDRRRHGSATARRPNRISTPRWSSPRPTRRRWCSTSSTISGRSRPSRASRAAAPAPSRRAASASAFLRCGSTATTILRSMPSPNGRSSGHAAISGPTLIEYVTYRVGAHSTSDDPSAYRPKTESDAWPLGDPVIRLKNHLIARRRLVGGAP